MKHLIIFFTVISLTTSTNVFSQGNKPLDVSNELLDSLSKFTQGTLESDLYYKLILEKHPNTPDAFMGRSVAYNKRGEPAIGFKLLNQAVDLDPLTHIGYRGFVKLYMMRDYNGALNDYLKLDLISSHSKPAAWGEDLDEVIGLCYLQINDLEQAAFYLNSSINRITKKDGEKWVSPRGFLYLGITLLKQKKYKPAIEAFDKLIRLNPNYSEAYYYKALCYFEQKQIKSAKKTIKECTIKFKNYGVETNSYFEMPYQIYSSMIVELSNPLNTSR